MLEIIIYIIGFIVVSIGFVTFFGAPYVPTLQAQIEDVMRLKKLTAKDVFVDVGSGDGVVLRVAAKSGAHVVGYELGPWLWLISKFLCRNYKNITIHFGNFWNKPLPPNTTVVYTFLNGKFMPKLEKKLQEHVNEYKRPISFITYGFELENRKPDRTRGLMFLYKFTPRLQT